MSYPTVQLFADFGDPALVLPVAALLLAYFAVRGAWRTAFAWVSALGLCGAATVAGKILFEACGGLLPDLAIRSPSGHVAGAALLYGALAVLAGAQAPRWRRAAGLALALALVALIGVSRVMQRAHSAEEVVAGAAIGAACVAWFAAWSRGAAVRGFRWMPAVALAAAAVATIHGARISFEPSILWLANRVHWHVAACRDQDPGARVRALDAVPGRAGAGGDG